MPCFNNYLVSVDQDAPRNMAHHMRRKEHCRRTARRKSVSVVRYEGRERMTSERLFCLALAIAAFGIGVFVLIDSIRWRVKRRRNLDALRQTGLRVDEDWLARREREQGKQ